MTLSAELKAEAQSLGFLLTGITTPAAPATFPEYKHWIERQYHAGMDYLASDRALLARSNPAALLENCQSILVLAMQYPAPRETQPVRPCSGQIAAYAQSADYHRIIPERLQRLMAWLSQRTSAPFQWYGATDTGPVMERDLAQRAGLGWAGKNTCIISPQSGSYFFLAEIFLTLPLTPDAPFIKNFCGTCRRCIQACPTGCISSSGHIINSAHCLAYLTIENKTLIPADLRPKLGNHVFGCDICQTVCPWNSKYAQFPPGELLFPPRPELMRVDLHSELQLSPQQFNQKFKHTPVSRAKRKGYLRNIAVVLGNLGDPSSIPVLENVMREEFEALVRGHAAWALGRFNTQKARRALEWARRNEMDAFVKLEIENALDQGAGVEVAA